MEINVVAMIEDELTTTKHYYEWSKYYINKDRYRSSTLAEISKQELSHAKFWISWLKDSEQRDYYIEKYNKLYRMIYGGEFNE